jgi:hypothetical protein
MDWDQVNGEALLYVATYSRIVESVLHSVTEM